MSELKDIYIIIITYISIVLLLRSANNLYLKKYTRRTNKDFVMAVHSVIFISASPILLFRYKAVL